jgi:tRNA dimethylallyltransferase
MELSLDRVEEARAVLIAGPTASGKSARAVELAGQAERAGRTPLIVNADSMQVYEALRVLTARPSQADERRFAHRLYGHVPPSVRYSAAAWLRDLAPVLAEAEAGRALPLIVGGTGLYFSTLTKGLSTIPAIPADVRTRLSEQLAKVGPAGLHSQLQRSDPASAATIRPTDSQRILRALEVLEATGRSLHEWRGAPLEPALLAGANIVRLVLEPDRGVLYRRIETRVDAMVAAGAVDEVRGLLDLGLPPDLPAMKAIGVTRIASYLRGEASLADAIAATKLDTRRYAKRQTTWFRNQMPDWERWST